MTQAITIATPQMMTDPAMTPTSHARQRYCLSLAHINDTHSNFDPSRVQFSVELDAAQYELHTHSGGYARISYQVERKRAIAKRDGHTFLFLHGGDSFQGTLYFSQFKGVANAHLLNLLKPDAMVLGNHEIDAGNAPVRAFLDRIEFPLLAGNMDLSQEVAGKKGELKGHRNLLDLDTEQQIAKVLFKPMGDKTLAIVGITLDQMKVIARPDPDTHFVDAIATTQRTVDHLKAKGIDHIIVLSHLGLDQDRHLAEAVDGISLIVGGHSHTLQGDFSHLGLSQLPYGEMRNGTPILHAGKYAETLGLADIEFDAHGQVSALTGNNYFMLDSQFVLQSSAQICDATYQQIKQTLDEHPGILWDDEISTISDTILRDYRPAIDALEHQVLAFIPRNLVHTRLPSKALPHGSEIAPWVSRSMYQEAKALDTRVDFALHNAGGVRQSLPKGNLTLAEVVGRILPFELPLVKYQIRGEYLYQALESAINAATNNSVIGTGAGSFPYTYGLRYFYDGRKPLGQRIIKLEIWQNDSWALVSIEQEYVGVSTAYTVAGKEGYHPLLQRNWQEPFDNLTLPQAFVQFVHKESLQQELVPHVNYISHHA